VYLICIIGNYSIAGNIEMTPAHRMLQDWPEYQDIKSCKITPGTPLADNLQKRVA